ncbi:MAG: hypothetical protein D3920_04110 [Candidatus Electrothrix sp. AW2]|nr:hypothetical protein [Candidatus Electrothrix gigas]
MAAMNRFFKASALYGGIAAALSVFFSVSQPVQAAPEPVQTEIGAIIQGRLEESDSRLSAGQYADAYSFIGTAGEEVLLNLASSDFDGFLWLLNSAGEVIAIDDNSGDGLGAVISKLTLPETDSYTIQASSYNNETGDYILMLNEAPQIDYAKPLVLGDRIQGRLRYEDDQFSTGQFFDAYTFEAQHGQVIFITMRSKRFDSYLWLLDEEGRVMAVNDDWKGGKGRRPVSQIIFFPPVAGTYTVLTSSKEPMSVGRYQLWLNTTRVPAKTKHLIETVAGNLELSDPQLSIGQYFDLYTLEGDVGKSVTLELESSDFDSYLRIIDSFGNVVRANDDSGGGTNSFIDRLVLPETGNYYVWVSSFFIGQTGDYTLHLNDYTSFESELSHTLTFGAEDNVQILFDRKAGCEAQVEREAEGDYLAAESASGDAPLNDICNTRKAKVKIEAPALKNQEVSIGFSRVSGPGNYSITTPPGGHKITLDANGKGTYGEFSIVSTAPGDLTIKARVQEMCDYGSTNCEDTEDVLSCAALTDSEWGVVHGYFPNLVRNDACKEAEATSTYNCIAWTIGDTSQWWWDQVDQTYGDNDGKYEVSDFDAFYAAKGVTGVTLYGNDASHVQHGAKNNASCNGTSSKLGPYIRMNHTAAQLSGGSTYGNILKTY